MKVAALYDNRNRKTSVSHANSSATVLVSESYVCNPARNLSSKTVGSTTTSYTYDNADQLLAESNPSYSASHTYDANGNRTSKTLGGVTDTYTVDNGDKLTSTSTKSYTYDADGRTKTVVSSAGTTTLNYDYEGRVTSIANPSGSTYTYSYNGLDTRVGKNEGTSQTFRRDGVDVTSPVLSDGVGHFTPGISEHTSATTFNHADRLGSYGVQTNSSQTVMATKTFDAFGNLLASTGAAVGPFGFVGSSGYQTDTTGLQLVGHRYYDSSTGRFLTRDKVKDGRNWYAYATQNPDRYTDASGCQVCNFNFPVDDGGFQGAGWTRGPSQYPFGRDWISPEGDVKVEFHWPNPGNTRGGYQPFDHWHYYGQDGDSWVQGPVKHYFPGEVSPVELPQPPFGPPGPRINPLAPVKPELPSNPETPGQFEGPMGPGSSTISPEGDPIIPGGIPVVDFPI